MDSSLAVVVTMEEEGLIFVYQSLSDPSILSIAFVFSYQWYMYSIMILPVVRAALGVMFRNFFFFFYFFFPSGPRDRPSGLFVCF
ncbi:hypothetical protein B0F90DRAFT_1736707 [Multifurca ochricompacta]|uniref:Uncharacterized protein n=1 Tax=Multifurca ochricompacta TaxID=376703 RepID=A0AAD4M0P2_9AGAM|nr:hypothetical protein B0F90DRAFT_1736707 [Multifurca ochricompacta]